MTDSDCLALPVPQCLFSLLDEVTAMRANLDEAHRSIMLKLNTWRSNHGEIEVWRRNFERERAKREFAVGAGILITGAITAMNDGFDQNHIIKMLKDAAYLLTDEAQGAAR